MTVISESQLSPELTSQTHKDVYVEANSSGISQEIKKKSAKAGPMLSLMQEREEGANTCWAAYESQPKATVLKVQGLSLAALGGRW